jgi:hypothetical protein
MNFIKYACLSATLLLCLGQFSMSATTQVETITPQQYRRLPDQTFLTYPEWCLVFSPEEFATFIKDNPPNEFPFLGHIGQFWGSYWAIYQETRGKYAFNTGYHVMVMVIGSSTTIEYGLRYVYENFWGRLSVLTRTHGMTNEDKLAADVAQNYVDFIKVSPWYEFNFITPLTNLWTQTGYRGDDQIRKWERKYALTTEYGIKAIYAKIIKIATKTAYDAPSPMTAIITDKHISEPTKGFEKIQILEKYKNGTELVLVPRYDEFKDYTKFLANKNIDFLEIAGNSSDILVSIVAPVEWALDTKDVHIIFSQPILTSPKQKRIVFTTPVHELSKVIRLFSNQNVKLEHIYDF